MNEGMYLAIIAELREINSNVRQLVDLMQRRPLAPDISTPPDEAIATGMHTTARKPAKMKQKVRHYA